MTQEKEINKFDEQEFLDKFVIYPRSTINKKLNRDDFANEINLPKKVWNWISERDTALLTKTIEMCEGKRKKYNKDNKYLGRDMSDYLEGHQEAIDDIVTSIKNMKP